MLKDYFFFNLSFVINVHPYPLILTTSQHERNISKRDVKQYTVNKPKVWRCMQILSIVLKTFLLFFLQSRLKANFNNVLDWLGSCFTLLIGKVFICYIGIVKRSEHCFLFLFRITEALIEAYNKTQISTSEPKLR